MTSFGGIPDVARVATIGRPTTRSITTMRFITTTRGRVREANESRRDQVGSQETYLTVWNRAAGN
jgi:hypothetical protein